MQIKNAHSDRKPAASLHPQTETIDHGFIWYAQIEHMLRFLAQRIGDGQVELYLYDR